MSGIPLINNAKEYESKTAILDAENSYMYSALLSASARITNALLAGEEDLEEARVAFLCPSGFYYVAVLWGIWRAGGIAVPLCPKHPLTEMSYVIEDSEASIILTHPKYKADLKTYAVANELSFYATNTLLEASKPKILPNISSDRRAMILYTSGTTGKPKGVVSTHKNITAQIECLITAWKWSDKDQILHILPLHHVHGIINKLCCALWVGASCEMLPTFDARKVWEYLGKGKITVFMAVPTIYYQLIKTYEQATEDKQKKWSAACKKMRLMVSGSAALPVSTLERWREITGHTLLERYGMTEIGMALSNSYEGERYAGCVGKPLPNVTVRIVNEEGQLVENGEIGELQVKGANVFLEYWNRPKASAEAFQDEWFRTGDIVQATNGVFKIIGRNSVDIIKTGGYKVSALEIEEILREHPFITNCAVVGVPDIEWGEIVAVALVLVEETKLNLIELKDWCASKLAPYKIPNRLLVITNLPKNVMGKVQKTIIKGLFDTEQ